MKMFPRRIAQWQSASTHTEEAAAFDSCSAYHISRRPHILFLSHCVPNPPDKGEKIRSHHELRYLAKFYNVHLVCFGRDENDVADALRLSDVCASIYVELVDSRVSIPAAMVRFVAGECLNEAFYRSRSVSRYIEELHGRVPLQAVFVYTAVMMQYAPDELPCVADLVDLDSEKWDAYAGNGAVPWLYRREADRLRALEERCCRKARYAFLVTRNEVETAQRRLRYPNLSFFENGIDLNYFDSARVDIPLGLEHRRFALFAGSMNYRPNVDAVCWFATSVVPRIREQDKQFQFLIVGRHPAKKVRRLERVPGVIVAGQVADVRPYIAASSCVVAPLQIARGIQNKVLEALSMGRMVLASPAVQRTFAPSTPLGVVVCESATQYAYEVARACEQGHVLRPDVREDVRQRFCWDINLMTMKNAVDDVLPGHSRPARSNDMKVPVR